MRDRHIHSELLIVHFQSDKTEEVRRLAMGRLLDDMSRKMEKKIERGIRDPLKILVHSTHDTAIAGLSSTLEIFEGRRAEPAIYYRRLN